MTPRSVRFDFSEPRAIAELESLCGPDGLKTVSTQEVLILLDWTRDKLRAHHKHHPGRPPRKSPKPKVTSKGWNAYLLADVVLVLKEEQAYWRAEQQRVKRRAETPIEKRRREERELNAAARAWPRTFSAWMNTAQLHDEWPVIRRASGPIEDMLHGLGSLQPGDQVLWMSLEAVLHALIAHRQTGSRSELVHF